MSCFCSSFVPCLSLTFAVPKHRWSGEACTQVSHPVFSCIPESISKSLTRTPFQDQASEMERELKIILGEEEDSSDPPEAPSPVLMDRQPLQAIRVPMAAPSVPKKKPTHQDPEVKNQSKASSKISSESGISRVPLQLSSELCKFFSCSWVVFAESDELFFL